MSTILVLERRQKRLADLAEMYANERDRAWARLNAACCEPHSLRMGVVRARWTLASEQFSRAVKLETHNHQRLSAEKAKGYVPNTALMSMLESSGSFDSKRAPRALGGAP